MSKQWKVLTAVVLAFSFNASAKEIVRGEPAKKMYMDLFTLQTRSPGEVTSYISGYFGDSERPNLGKLWVTTIYLNVTKPTTFCFESNFREAGVVEYMCEIY